MSRLPLAAALLLTATLGSTKPPPVLPAGTVIEDVRCADDPSFGYSLYLPSAYPADRRWPVLYVFSPAARGVVPVRELAAAAERFGYILIGSNEVKDGPWEPVFAAQKALWKEVNRRFAVDPKRSYGTGFSGGARDSVELALKHRGRFAGLILCGAMFSPRTDFPDRGGLVVVGLVGDADLNLEEHLRSERLLESLGYSVWQEVFVGGHRWPDAELYGSALELLEVDAMRRGLEKRDDAFIADVARDRLARARALDQGGAPLLALHELREIRSFFPGSAAATEADRLTTSLLARPEMAAAQAAEGEYLQDLRALNDWRAYAPFRAAVEQMRRRVSEGGRQGERARLVLHLLSIFLSESGTGLLTEGKVKDAASVLQVASAVYPANALADYNAACALARAGERDSAVQLLEAAARARFNDIGLLDRDVDLDSLRELPAFAAVRASVVANHEQGLAPAPYRP